MATITPDRLMREVAQLSKRYEQLFASTDDLKALQGMERCLEMKMKICGLDGKQPLQSTQINQTPNNLLPLTELPTELLELLLSTLSERKSTSQN